MSEYIKSLYDDSLTFVKLVEDYYKEKYQEMRKFFNKLGIVNDVFIEIGKYLNDSFLFNYIPFDAEDYYRTRTEGQRLFISEELPLLLLPEEISSQVVTIFYDTRQVVVGYTNGCQVRMFYSYKEYLILYDFYLHGRNFDAGIDKVKDFQRHRHDSKDYSYDGIFYLMKNHFHVFERKKFDHMKFIYDLEITDLTIIVPILRFFSRENFDNDFKSIVNFVENYC
jgi:hypothetical protein